MRFVQLKAGEEFRNLDFLGKSREKKALARYTSSSAANNRLELLEILFCYFFKT